MVEIAILCVAVFFFCLGYLYGHRSVIREIVDICTSEIDYGKKIDIIRDLYCGDWYWHEKWAKDKIGGK